MPKGNAFAEMAAGLDPGDFALLSSAVQERECREAVGFGTFADAASLYRPQPACPSWGTKGAWRDGHEESGLQRFRCRSCGRRYSSLTGTVLEHSKADMAAWVQFVRLMRFSVPLDAAAEICGVSHLCLVTDNRYGACPSLLRDQRTILTVVGTARWLVFSLTPQGCLLLESPRAVPVTRGPAMT